MNQETQSAEDICEWLGSPFGAAAGRAWLTPLRDAYQSACGARIFLNYVVSLLGVAQAQLEHSGADRLTPRLSANFDLERMQDHTDAQLANRAEEVNLDFPGNWRFTVCCFQAEASEHPVCRSALLGPGVTYHYPPQAADGTVPHVSLEQAIGDELVVKWLREAVQTYMEQGAGMQGTGEVSA